MKLIKCLTLISLLLLGQLSFSQSVPDTETFSLQDVVTAVNPTTDDLVQCFADAVTSYFDNTYYDTGNDMYEFRNYGSDNSPYDITSNPSVMGFNLDGSYQGIGNPYTYWTIVPSTVDPIVTTDRDWISVSVNYAEDWILVSVSPSSISRSGSVILTHPSDTSLDFKVLISQN